VEVRDPKAIYMVTIPASTCGEPFREKKERMKAMG
jgi:hypothetical protein